MNYLKKKSVVLTILFLPLLLLASCQSNGTGSDPEKDDGDNDNGSGNQNDGTTWHNVESNEFSGENDRLAKTLLITRWKDYTELIDMSPGEMREFFINELDSRSAESVYGLDDLSNEEMAWNALMYRFLHQAEVRSPEELSEMELHEWRAALINKNAEETESSKDQLEGYTTKKNVHIGYRWWLAREFSSEIAALEDATGNTAHHQLQDDEGNTMDVLRILKVDQEDYDYVGVYHNYNPSSELFELFLAGSNDLQNWEQITNFGGDRHQGDIEAWGDGYLVTNESSGDNGNFIELHYFPSYSALKENEATDYARLPRLFSQFAEGTPGIRKIEGDDPDNSTLLIGFHYFNNGVVDEPAIGILENFNSWRAWKDHITHYNLRDEMSVQGNIGGRAQFDYKGNNLVLREARRVSGDWSTWRFFFGIDDAFYHQLNIQTDNNSTSFANPGISKIGEDRYGVTSFMPAEGNDPSESGELLYEVQF